jgi:hypothetical protein
MLRQLRCLHCGYCSLLHHHARRRKWPGIRSFSTLSSTAITQVLIATFLARSIIVIFLSHALVMYIDASYLKDLQRIERIRFQ